MFVDHIPALYLNKSEQGVGSPGTGVIDGCESPCRHLESDRRPLGEQPELSPMEPSLQPR